MAKNELRGIYDGTHRRELQVTTPVPPACPDYSCSNGDISYVYRSGAIEFQEALHNPPYPNCYLIPISEAILYGAKNLMVTDAYAWVGAKKDLSFLIDTAGKKLNGDPVNNWKSVDGSPWPVNGDNVDTYWNPVEPDNGMINNYPAEQYIVLDAGTGKLCDAPNNLPTLAGNVGAIYKCCSSECAEMQYMKTS